MKVGHGRPLTACLFVFGTELSHTRSSQSEYATGTYPTISLCECPPPPFTSTPLPLHPCHHQPPAHFLVHVHFRRLQRHLLSGPL